MCWVVFLLRIKGKIAGKVGFLIGPVFLQFASQLHSEISPRPVFVTLASGASGFYAGSLLPVFYGNKFLKVGKLQKGIKLEMIPL